MIERIKVCGGCRRPLIVIKGETFNGKRGTEDGLQPFCRQCDQAQKCELEKGYRVLMRFLEGKRDAAGRPIDPSPCMLDWSKESYLAVFAAGTGHGGRERDAGCCYWCGGRVNGWTKGDGTNAGYWIDRRGNRKLKSGHKDYSLRNAIPCCSPCNFAKGAKHSGAFGDEAEARIGRYGWGCVQWDEIDDVWVKSEAVCLARFVVDNQLALFPGPRGAA